MKTGYDDFFKKAKRNAGAAAGSFEKKSEAKFKTNPQAKSFKNSPRAGIKRRKFPLVEFIAFIGFSLLMLTGYAHYDEIEKQLGRLDVSFTSAQAEEKATPKSDSIESSGADKPALEKVAQRKNEERASDEADYLFKLSERKKTLDQREDDLNKLSQEIAKQKVDIEEKLKKLEETRQRISSLLEERIKADDSRIETLVQMYTNMKPQQAAKVFETMDEELVIEILGRMKKKSAADILNLVKPEKAQVLAERYVGYRAPASQ